MCTETFSVANLQNHIIPDSDPESEDESQTYSSLNSNLSTKVFPSQTQDCEQDWSDISIDGEFSQDKLETLQQPIIMNDADKQVCASSDASIEHDVDHKKITFHQIC